MNLRLPGTGQQGSSGGYGGSNSELVGRKKVTLKPGHSLMDWIRLGRNQGDLSGVPVKRKNLTLEELALHNRPDDIWMALRGKVYNITPYMNYHPGGTDELMRAAGKDGTELFDEIHNWVNLESMLEKCFIGTVDDTRATSVKRKESKPKLLPPVVTESQWKSTIEQPKYNWYQNDEAVTVVIYTKWPGLAKEFFTCEISANEVLIHLQMKGSSFFLSFKPTLPVSDIPSITITKGKAEIRLDKVSTQRHWPSLGDPLLKHEKFLRTKALAPVYRKWTLTSNTAVTHNVVLLRLKAPKGLTMRVPLGYHIHIVNKISGMHIGRSYTVVSPSLTQPHTDQEQEAGRAIHLMVKHYPGGALSPYVTQAKVGTVFSVSDYDGTFDAQCLDGVTELVLFAAGTGLTSFIRIISYALDEIPQAKFPIKLVFYNRTQADILWREQLEKLAAKNPRFSVVHILSQEPDNSAWTGLRGRVSPDHVSRFVPAPTKICKPLLCICGQWAYNDSVERLAELHGLKEEHIYTFGQSNSATTTGVN